MPREPGPPPEPDDADRTRSTASDATVRHPPLRPSADPDATRPLVEATRITPAPNPEGSNPEDPTPGVATEEDAPGPAANAPATLPAAAPGLNDELLAFGRYRIERELGRGGMGTVYLARDVQLGRNVALKVPSEEVAANRQLADRFLTEARAAAAVRHPHLCPVYDAGLQNGRLFITMAYLPGQTLRDAFQGPQPIGASVRLVSRLADAMAHAHDHGVIHRDLKPGNVMLDEQGLPHVTDFGLARLMTAEEEASRITQTGSTVGTPAYMSPEQIAGDPDQVGPQTDIYALGVILYGLLTGRPPFDGPPSRVMAKAYSEDPRPPGAVRLEENPDLPPVPPALEAIWRRMVARRRADRFQTMREVHAALAGFAATGGVDTRVGGGPAVEAPSRRDEPEPAFAALPARGAAPSTGRPRNARLFWGTAAAAALALTAAAAVWLPGLATDPPTPNPRLSGEPTGDSVGKPAGESTGEPDDGSLELTADDATADPDDEPNTEVSNEDVPHADAPIAKGPAADEGWIELIDAKARDDWIGDSEVWSVRDGMLVGYAPPTPREKSLHVRHEALFGNARIRVVYKPLRWYYAGVLVRMQPGEGDDGVMAHTFNSHRGSMGGKFRRMDGRPGPSSSSPANAGRAFDAMADNGEPEGFDVLEVRVVGDKFESFRNGVPIAQETFPTAPETGHVGLRLVSTPHHEVGVEVRSFRVLPLDEHGKPDRRAARR